MKLESPVPEIWVFKVGQILQFSQKKLEKWDSGIFKLLCLIFHFRNS